MKVLSLFDGISCGRLALERASIPVERYVAYEIEPNAIYEEFRSTLATSNFYHHEKIFCYFVY